MIGGVTPILGNFHIGKQQIRDFETIHILDSREKNVFLHLLPLAKLAKGPKLDAPEFGSPTRRVQGK